MIRIPSFPSLARPQAGRWPAALLAGAWLLATTLATTPAAAQAAPAAPLPAGIERVTAVEGVTEYRLGNGLQLLLVPDDAKPTTTVNLTLRVGSRHESYGETGMAHLLEHLIFKGTPTTRNVWAEFMRRGLRANGTTSFDRTNYFASFSENPANLDWYLGWLADAMVNSLIARSDLDTEMTVVRNEFENGENNPFRVLLQKTMATMYQWHNYGKSTIGARSDIENVDIGRLQAFYRRHYQPDNATLIVSGRFDTDAVLRRVAGSFGTIARPTRVLQPTYTLDPPQDGERRVEVRRSGGSATLLMAYHVPPASHADWAALNLLASVLGDAPAGRLHKRLVEQRLAAQTAAFAWGLAEPGPLFTTATLAPGQDLDRARAEMSAVLDGLAAEPPTAEELERARTRWLNAWDLGFTDPERIGVELTSAIALGDWRLHFLQRDRIRAVTPADLQRVAATWVRRDNRTIGLYRPTDQPARAPAPARVDVAAALQGYRGDPATVPAEAFDPTPDNLDRRTQVAQVGGLKLALLPKGTRGGVVHARLRLHLGDERSLQGQETVASLLGELLDRGGAGLTRQQIADRFDQLQAQVNFFGSGQTLGVNLSTRRRHLPDVMELVGRLLREPAFAADALEEVRRQRLAGLERVRQDPDALILKRIARHGNPYPRGDLRHEASFEETEEDLRRVDVATLQGFHRRFVSAASGEFSAAGDFDPAAVQQALRKALGDWRVPAEGALPYRRVPQPLVAAPPARFVERTPDKANANLRGRLALPISDRHADHAALTMANYLFGIGGSSRLWMRIREGEGLSYDVRSVLDWSSIDEHTTWNVSAIFAPQNQPRVEAALKEELARSLRDGFTQAELDTGRVGLLNFRRLARAQDNAVASQLAQNLFLGRRFDFVRQVDEALQGLTLDQVNAAWRRYIQPDRLVLAWGGDFKAP